MKKFSIALYLLIALLFSACSNDDSEVNLNTIETISFSSQCGWCAGSIGIVITNNKSIEFTQSFNCSSENNVQESRSLTNDEIEKLTDALELETFLKIDLNQCGTCYDGCDETLRIKANSGINHEIQFDHLEYEELEDIQSLIDVLQEIRSSFN